MRSAKDSQMGVPKLDRHKGIFSIRKIEIGRSLNVISVKIASYKISEPQFGLKINLGDFFIGLTS